MADSRQILPVSKKDLFQKRGGVKSVAVVRTHGAAFEKNALVFILSFTQLLTLVIVTVLLHQQSLLHSLMVLSFSSAAEAIMFSVGWQAVHRTTSVWPSSFCTISFVCRFQM